MARHAADASRVARRTSALLDAKAEDVVAFIRKAKSQLPEDEAEHKVSWDDLFFDLSVVASFIDTASLLELWQDWGPAVHHDSHLSFAHSVTLFCLVSGFVFLFEIISFLVSLSLVR